MAIIPEREHLESPEQRNQLRPRRYLKRAQRHLKFKAVESLSEEAKRKFFPATPGTFTEFSRSKVVKP